MRKPLLKYLILLSLPLLFIQCEVKDDPLVEKPLDQTDPLFWISAEVDGDLHVWEAGQDDIVLDPSQATSGSVGGKFHQPDCATDCRPEISLEWLVPADVSSISINSLEDLVDVAQYPFSRPPDYRPHEVKIRLHGSAVSGNADSYFWEISDGRTTSEQDPLLVFYPTEANSSYEICLTVKNSNGQSSQICNTVDLLSECQYQFEYEQINDKVFFWTNDQYIKGSYSWTLGNGHSVITSSFETNYPGYVTADLVRLRGKTVNGCQWEWQRWVPAHQSDELLADFSYDIVKSTPATLIEEHNITVGIKYNLLGTTYASSIKAQPVNSKFEVTSIQDISLSQLSGTVKRVSFEFACDLYDEHNNKISITNGQGVVAIEF